ncbi:hypothetical protein FA95DRAFT_375761 [Auriscalpium vulgare]|uniref:Uncharacterized protein n=1 Tax=Auriscalpium vulgare TaxID=40419 RepID=A0ACB8RHJ8_9AGAM|nr:hypothetical protein FA95DRAFT_375761 [Auriscalpium vulgare]
MQGRTKTPSDLSQYNAGGWAGRLRDVRGPQPCAWMSFPQVQKASARARCGGRSIWRNIYYVLPVYPINKPLHEVGMLRRNGEDTRRVYCGNCCLHTFLEAEDDRHRTSNASMMREYPLPPHDRSFVMLRLDAPQSTAKRKEIQSTIGPLRWAGMSAHDSDTRCRVRHAAYSLRGT